MNITKTDNFIDFSHSSDWQTDILDYAHSYAQKVRQDYQEFCQGMGQAYSNLLRY